MRYLILTAIAAATVATPALAQDKGPFTGPHVDAVVGYDVIKDGMDSPRTDGLTYGGAIGYDAKMGHLVVGAEAELTDSSAKNRSYGAFTAGDRFALDAGRDIYVGGRIGTTLTPTTLLYAKAGYTNARINADYTVGGARFTNSQNMDGYRVGAGLEQALAPNLYVKAEYRYSNYGTLDAYDAKVERHQALAGVGLRF